LKRDMELIRKVLFYIEEKGNSETLIRQWDIDGYDFKEISYQVKLLVEHGLVNGRSSGLDGVLLWYADSLTWDGHDFLDAIKNDTIWDKVKSGIKSKGLELGQVSFGVLKEYAKAEIKSKLGIQ
jgi:hypothetical protein